MEKPEVSMSRRAEKAQGLWAGVEQIRGWDGGDSGNEVGEMDRDHGSYGGMDFNYRCNFYQVIRDSISLAEQRNY